jgi:methylenetetrahydrofolate reductase (NADPH)
MKNRMSVWERRLSHGLCLLEDAMKKPVFRCQSCGECILSHSAFICSQRYPKRMRNGPCGGTREGGFCEVYPERKCIWTLIARRSALLRRSVLLLRIERAHDWELEKTSAWLNVFRKRIEPPVLLMGKKKRHELEREN